MRGKRASRIAAWVCGCALSLPPGSASAEFPFGNDGPAASTYRRTEQSFHVPDAILTDPWGKSFSLAQELAADGPVLLNFFSTAGCEEECGRATRLFAELQTQRGPKQRNLRLISIAVDPRQDTPARLRAWAKQAGAGRDWMLLTGMRRELNPVLQAFGVADGLPPPVTTFLHANPGAAWVRLDGFVSPAEILAELR